MKYLVLGLLFTKFLFAITEFKCPTHEKFIKSYKYISRLKNVDLKKKEVIDFAMQISSKCHNTYKRFDDVFEVTEKTDLPVKASIYLAIRIALDKEIDTSNLERIFKFLIKPDGPDLPYASAMGYAEKFAKKGRYAYSLLKEIFTFCLEHKEINMPRPSCVRLAEKVANLGIKKDTIFEDAYLYFSKNKNLDLNSKKSIDMTLKILKYGKDSFEDFKKLFEFALDKKGVNLSRDESLKLALKILKNAELTELAKKELEKEKLAKGKGVK